MKRQGRGHGEIDRAAIGLKPVCSSRTNGPIKVDPAGIGAYRRLIAQRSLLRSDLTRIGCYCG